MDDEGLRSLGAEGFGGVGAEVSNAVSARGLRDPVATSSMSRALTLNPKTLVQKSPTSKDQLASISDKPPVLGFKPAEALRSWTSTPKIESFKNSGALLVDGSEAVTGTKSVEAIKKSNSLPLKLDQSVNSQEKGDERASFLQSKLDRETNLALYGVSNVEDPSPRDDKEGSSRQNTSPKFARYFSRSVMYSKSQAKLEMPVEMHHKRSMAMKQLRGGDGEGSEQKAGRAKTMRRFQEKGKQVIVARRATQQLQDGCGVQENQARKKASWSERSMPWFSQVLDPASTLVITVNTLAAMACISDILVMFLEASSYSGSRPCTEAGGAFSDECKGLRGYLGPSVYSAKMTLGVLSDLIYMFDIYLHFRTARDVTWFQTSIDAKAVATDYMFGRFAWDLIASAPIYWIFCRSPWVRLNRIMRVFNFGKINRFVKLLVAMGIQLNPQVLRICRFLLFITCWMHVVACCTMIVAWQALDHPDGEDLTSRWLDLDSAEKVYEWKFLYLHCQYWAWTNLTGWGGEWSPQSAAMIGWTFGNQIIGVFLYMYIFGEIVSILQNFDMAEAEFNAKRDMVNRFLNIREVPKDVQVRVHNWFERMWEAKHGTEEEKVLEYLPPFLRHDLAWHLNKLFIDRVPMFIGADATALMEVNRYLAQTVATAGEYIIRSGEIGREMYFVISGSLELLNEDNSVHTQLYEGSVIGEIPLLLGIPSPHTIRAKCDCDLLKLSDKDFGTIIDFFPALRRKLERRGAMVYGTNWKEWEAMAALGGGPSPEEVPQGGATATTSEAHDTLQFDFFARRTSVTSASSLPDQSFCARPRSGASDNSQQQSIKEVQTTISILQDKQELMLNVLASLQESQLQMARGQAELLNLVRPITRTSSYNPKENTEADASCSRLEGLEEDSFLAKFGDFVSDGLSTQEDKGKSDGVKAAENLAIPSQPASSGSTTALVLESGFDRPSSFSSTGGCNPSILMFPGAEEPADSVTSQAYLDLPGVVEPHPSSIPKYNSSMATKVEESVEKFLVASPGAGGLGLKPLPDKEDGAAEGSGGQRPEELDIFRSWRHQS